MLEDSLVDDLLLKVEGLLVVEELEIVDGLIHDGSLDVIDVLLPPAEPVKINQPIQLEESVALASEFSLERAALHDGCPAVQFLNAEESIYDSVDVVEQFLEEALVVVGGLQDLVAEAHVH